MELWFLRLRLYLAFWFAKRRCKKLALALLSVEECRELAVKMRSVSVNPTQPEPYKEGDHPKTGLSILDKVLEKIWIWALNRLTGNKND